MSEGYKKSEIRADKDFYDDDDDDVYSSELSEDNVSE